MRRRLLVTCVLFALPTVVLCAVGVYFLVMRLPQLERRQKAAITREYRAAAEEMWRNPSAAKSFGPRQKGWRQTSRIGRGGESVAWGHVQGEEGEIVWCGNDRSRVAMTVLAPSEGAGIAIWMYCGVSAVLALLVSMTAFGIWCLWHYNRTRSDFLSATVHDLTTPLVAMRQLIGKDDEYARLVNERMLRLVENVSGFLRPGGRRSQPKFEVFALGEAFREAYRLFDEDFAEEDCGAVGLTGECDAEVSADRMMTVQILWNLLGNDLKYASGGGAIEARIRTDGGRVLLTLSDQGPGMTPRQLRRAFDRYYRAKTVLETGKGGFGIGLCTSREFARAMGGELSVRANRPCGCVFELSLPVAAPQAKI